MISRLPRPYTPSTRSQRVNRPRNYDLAALALGLGRVVINKKALAQRAGLSPRQVDRVLNRNGHFSLEARYRVEEALGLREPEPEEDAA